MSCMQVIEEIGLKCPKVAVLDIENCHTVTSTCLEVMIAWLRNLNELLLSSKYFRVIKHVPVNLR